MSVTWSTHIRLNRTHWAFWSGGKGLSLAEPPCSFLSLYFTFVLPSSVFPLLFSFSLFPFHALALLREERCPFCPWEHINNNKTLLQMGWRESGQTSQLARVTHCCGHQIPSWTQHQPKSLKTNSRADGAQCSAVSGDSGRSWKGFFLFFLFFPKVRSPCQAQKPLPKSHIWMITGRQINA